MPGRRLHVPVHLRWGDLDAFGHVNNVSMLKLLEEARVRALWAPEVGEPAFPTAVMPSGADAEVITLIARHEIEYLRPVPYRPEPLDVRLWFGSLGGASAEVCYEVHSPEDSLEPVLYARSSAVVVAVDPRSGRPVRLAPHVRAAWQPYLGEPIRFTVRR